MVTANGVPGKRCRDRNGIAISADFRLRYNVSQGEAIRAHRRNVE